MAVLLIGCVGLFPKAFTSFESICGASILFSHAPWMNENPLKVEPFNNYHSDEVDAGLPHLIYSVQTLLRGEIPGYSDKLQNGKPYYWLVGSENKVFPLLLIAAVFGVPFGLTVYHLAKLILGGLFLFKFLRRFGLRPSVGILAAVVFSFNTYPLGVLGIQHHLQYVLIPILLFAIERVVRDRSILWMFLLPLLIQMHIFSGYPSTTASCFILLAAFSVLRIFSLPRETIVPTACLMGLLAVVGVLISMPMLVATGVYYSRSFDWDFRANYWANHFHADSLHTYLLPFLHGISWMRWGTYLGILPVVITIIGLAFGPYKRIRVFFICFLLWHAAILYDLFGFLSAVYRHIPVLNTSMPTNQTQAYLAVLSIVFAFSLEAVLVALESAAARTKLMIALVVSILLVAAPVLFEFPLVGISRDSKTHLIHQSIILILSIGLFAFAMGARRRLSVFTTLAMVLVTIDLVSIGSKWDSSIPQKAFYPTTQGIQFLKQNLGEGKLFMTEAHFLPNTPLAYALPTIAARGHFSSEDRDMYHLINAKCFQNHKTAFYFPFSPETRLMSPFIDALGIKFVVVPLHARPDDAREESVLDQPHWNAEQRLESGQKIRQSFQAGTDLPAEVLRVRLGSTQLQHPAQLTARILAPSGPSRDFSLSLEPQGPGTLVFNLQDVSFREGENYQVELEFTAQASDSISLLFAHHVNLIPTGQISFENNPIDGDLLIYLGTAPKKVGYDKKFRLAYDKEMTLWENKNAFPRAWLVDAASRVPWNDALQHMQAEDFDYAKQAWVVSDETNLPGLSTSRSNVLPLESSLETLTLGDNVQKFRVKASRPALMVVNNNFDPDWKVTVNGAEADLLKVNCFMRGVEVPAGSSEVLFRYQPNFLTLSYVVALGTFVAFIVFLALQSRRILSRSKAVSRN